ncbi:MAG: NAD(P)/FAD-dependent oxidoreductase [Candidatus Bathyarchaeota archaeon]|nr:NAD(P)/FAD-dependent oxidoreductase [Candidatus Bathyarchaeota archaeon]
MPKPYDAVVVGAGTGGCMAAKTLASAGLSVCLVDRKKKESIGEKVCGDAIGKHHFDNLGLAYPTGKEKEGDIAGIKIYSPDSETIFRLVGGGLTGFIINRYLFGQRLLKEAVDAGAVLLGSTHVSAPIIEGNFVKGILTRNLETGSKTEVRGKATVDASGVSAAVRSRLPAEFGIDSAVSKADQVVCYREIREVKEGMEEKDFCEIYLDLKSAPGGYYWIFPEGEMKVNVGLGVAPVGRYPSPKGQLFQHVLSRRLFEASSVINSGGGIVPTRRPLDSLVGNGVVLVGDSACQVNPVHGGGIGPSMMGGKISGEVIMEALEAGEPSRERLWPVNVRFMNGYGTKQAGLDVFRIFLQGLINEDLDFGMRYRLIKEDDILKASVGGDLHLNVTDATRRVFRGLGRLLFLKRLHTMARMVKRVKILYGAYPESPEGMPEWKAKAHKLFNEARSAL